jgi:hypothetical protein
LERHFDCILPIAIQLELREFASLLFDDGVENVHVLRLRQSASLAQSRNAGSAPANSLDSHLICPKFNQQKTGEHCMKTKNAVGLVIGGMLLGVCITLCLGAGADSRKETSRLQIVTYPAGTTGIFDPDKGRLYLYDINVANCFMIREITTLGEPMKQLRN